jgi:hypothetical protein
MRRIEDAGVNCHSLIVRKNNPIHSGGTDE